MLDRANPLFTTDYNFRDIYLLASAAEDGEETVAIGFVLNHALGKNETFKEVS